MENKNTIRSDRYMTALVWTLIGVVARLIPHPANVSPMNSLCLFGGSQLKPKWAFAQTLAIMVLSDILLSSLRGYALFGWWSLFTYTGFAAIVLAGTFLRKTPTAGRTLSFITASSVGFWVWTNFGIWLTGDHGMYPHTMSGLVACYSAAIPFLGNSLAGDLAWGFVFFLSFQGVRKLAPKYGWSIQGA